MSTHRPRSASEVLAQVFDPATETLKTNTTAVTIENVSLEVNLDAAGGDSIKVSDGSDTLAVNSDGSINVNLVGTIAVELDAADGDSVKVSDGANDLVVNSDGSINTKPVVYSTRVDEASSTVTYIGKAVPGSDESAAVWQVQMMDTSGVLTITLADGNDNFDNVWDDRATLTYE